MEKRISCGPGRAKGRRNDKEAVLRNAIHDLDAQKKKFSAIPERIEARLSTSNVLRAERLIL